MRHPNPVHRVGARPRLARAGLCPLWRTGPLTAWLLAGLLSVASAREDVVLDAGWHFYQGDPQNAQSPDFNDGGWQTLAIPHCWGWEQAQKGEKYLQGAGWYRRQLDLGVPQPNKRYFIKFEAAGSVADAYLNGKFLGQHRGAFGAFCFELTTNLSASSTNLLAVRVSNAPEPDVAPLSGDFPVYGGLYRPVHLITTDSENIAPTDHGSPGVAWLQTSVSSTQAVLEVTAQISNGARRRQSMTLVARVLDAQGRDVTNASENVVLDPVYTEPVNMKITLANPHLWNGRKDPYLYRAVMELRLGDALVDSVEQPLGLRSFYIDPDTGFYLNGQPYHLHGVNRHQDRPDKGWAITEADMDEDMALLKELGVTAIRCCHYQHSDYFYSLCDRAGILVWAELSQVDRIGGDAKFEETSQNQLRDLIRQNINHPSIFAWSLFNELRPNGGRNPDPHRELQDLKTVVNGEDPTRPTTAATCTTTEMEQMNKIPDILGWNVYYGWYGDWGALSNYDSMRAKFRYTSRHGGYAISEYGAGANVAQHEENPRKPKNDGQWHPEEYQAIYHEAAWPQLKAAPYIWGTFVWNFADFASYWRHEGNVPGRNDKGLITFDRKTKKDAFYYYQANWSDEPMIYIASRRFTERTNAVTDVKIYSNAKTAELFVNGTSQGRRDNDGNSVFVWRQVKLASGPNAVKAQAQSNGQALNDECQWNLTLPR